MSTPVEFQQVVDPKGDGTKLYETREPGSVGWAGYLVMANVALKQAIGITDSLNGVYNGSYIFCASRPAVIDSNPADFIKLLTGYINSNSSGNRILFWLQSSSAPYFGAFTRFGLQFGPNINLQWQINSNLNANLGQNLTLNVQSSLIVTPDEANSQIVLSVRSSSNPLVNLQVGGTHILDAVPVATQIPVSGANTGCLLFTGPVNPAVMFARSPLGISQGVQFTYTDGAGADQSLFYPAFNTASWPASVQMIGAFDPSDPVNSVISAVDLQTGHLRSGLVFTGTPALPSCFQTPQGNAISLVPLGTQAGASAPALASGALALQSSSPASTPIGAALIYFSPARSFGVSGAGTAAGQPVAILGGLFGSESLNLTSYSAGVSGNVLSFLPSQPAYAPIFPFQNANLQNSGSGSLQPRLTGAYQTSWATVLPAGGAEAIYQAEPEGSALYGNPQQTPPVLASTPPKMVMTASTQNTFPLAPYTLAPASTPSAASTITQFESQIIAPTRKKVISSSATATIAARNQARVNFSSAAEQQYSTTPQGFLVTSDPATGAYLNVLLAQSSDDTTVATLPFSFGPPTPYVTPVTVPVSPQLENALQSNQLFLVAVDPTHLTPFQNLANVAGWKLAAQVGQGVSATSYRNVMIMKFCSGTLLERVTNPNRWTSAEDFSLAPGTTEASASIAYAGLSQWLQAYILAGIAKANGASESAAFYQNFAQIAQDPTWNGIIVLEADLSPSDLPPQIAGLAAGIDFTQFTAHHFGFTVSRVAAFPGQTPPLAMQGVSSFFGLIDYEEPAYAQSLAAGVSPDIPIPVPASGDFQFTVLLLQVLFENSRIANFRSNVQLTVQSLLGSSVTQSIGNAVPGVSNGNPMPVNAIVLDGSYVAQSGAGSTANSYIFEQTKTTVFLLNSNALPAIAFDRIQFNTLSNDGTVTTSRFLVWGAFDFAELYGTDNNVPALFDVLSFGSPAGTPSLQLGSGLSFSNFAIGLSSLNSTPNAQNFAVTTANLSYDLNASTVRTQSLFRGFGLQLKNFISASDDETPANFGFLPVTSNLNLVTLAPPWYGVVYQVTLGGPGALASAAGFNSDLLLAWSPSAVATDASQAVFIGLSLPGASPGAKLISLQGIFKVSVGSITLLRQSTAGGGGMSYCLRLDDIGIKIFGIAKLPPDATIQFFLFGDPNSTGSLGWYAAYVANPSTSGGQTLLAPLNESVVGGHKVIDARIEPPGLRPPPLHAGSVASREVDSSRGEQ